MLAISGNLTVFLLRLSKQADEGAANSDAAFNARWWNRSHVKFMRKTGCDVAFLLGGDSAVGAVDLLANWL